MTTRATSKAALLEERERGNISTQEEKILEIISLGGNLSLQEIMSIYRGKHGNIELSSVSARCNKLKADGKIKEDKPRHCSISDKTINPLTANTCTHEKYKGDGYMMADNAMKALKRNEIVWVGMVIQECECGADISHAKRVPIRTYEQWKRENK
jgi:hypothetical protein